MTTTDQDDDYRQTDSALFWIVIAVAFFAAAGFIAGVLYPYYM